MPYSKLDSIQIPAMQHPAFRTALAVQDGVEKNLIFKTWGGLGDQICAEPTLRFALKQFKDCNISLATERPELFTHLKFDSVFDLKIEQPEWENYLVFDTITPPDESNLVWLFFSHLLTNCVDFPSMCALRSQLPIKDKEINLIPTEENFKKVRALAGHLDLQVVVHPGKHWETKTFPKSWWDEILKLLIQTGFTPILIGADADDNRTTVNVNTEGCLDLRNTLSVMESVALLQDCDVLLTNDSSPLHMAASNHDTWILYFATCKHPDFISHWRDGKWNERMENLSKGGIWELVDYCPNKEQTVEVDKIHADILMGWLPTPQEVVNSVVAKFQ